MRQDLPTLTSLRFPAALMIFVFHLREFAPSDWAFWIAPGMFHGVSFFFVLSGFVLTHVYHGRNIPAAQFYRARFARIAPLHVVCLLLLLAVLPLPLACGQRLGGAATLATFVVKLTMLDAWIPVRSVQSAWNNVSWSISAEMAFYAAFPLLSAAMARWPAATLAASVALSAAVLSAGVAVGMPVFSTDGLTPTLIQLGCDFPLARGFEFVLGMATCLVWRKYIAPARFSIAVWTAAEAAALAITLLWLFCVAPALVHGANGATFVALRASGSAPIFALLLAVLAGGRGIVGQALSKRPLVKLGEASFAFYLVHVIVLRALAYHLGSTGMLAPFAISLGLAFVLHEGVELPLRRRLLAPAAIAVAPAQAA